MNKSATDSSLEIAAWFLARAKRDEWFLETEKLQHLLFLAQVHYAAEKNSEMLMPSLFLINRNGFVEPCIAKICACGFQFDEPNGISFEVAGFLEKIWKLYGAMSLRQLSEIIKHQTHYPDLLTAGDKIVADLKSLVEKFKISGNIHNKSEITPLSHKKILISQNGPVVVSQWKPRKLG